MKPPDKNLFFRELTLCICGSLEIEKGLMKSIEYLSRFMPADRLYLQRYEPGLRSMHLIARADHNNCEKLNMMIPLSDDAYNEMVKAAEALQAGNLPSVFVINQPQESAITTCILNALGEPISSAMSLPLIVENQVIGSFVVLAEGDDRYTEEHRLLYASLKEPFFVALSNALEHREVLKLQKVLADENQFLKRELHRIQGEEIIGANFGLQQTMDHVRQVASLDSPVLLSGETGTGKDVIANAIHYSSPRSKGPFVSVNCGAIPESLIDSELFGHEKGAFTGAIAQKIGRFERAEGGTLFLDEIGELPLEAQVRLLRALQSREIERVGGTKTIKLNIRIIAATNRNLEEMVETGKFREDLWFRLNVFPIWIPPLRERTLDIPALLQHFIHLKSQELKLPSIPKVAPKAIDVLMGYHWPGNVRELQNVVERALIINPKGPISFDRILTVGNEKYKRGRKSDNLDDMVASHIKDVLNKTGGKIHGTGGAAEKLGINASTLRNRMNKLGIEYGRKMS